MQIEILTYCQLTSRQRLLYQALRNKISIEDLLQSSMGTAQQSHTTTSSLMNLVMQFRKVGKCYVFNSIFLLLSSQTAQVERKLHKANTHYNHFYVWEQTFSVCCQSSKCGECLYNCFCA